MSTVTDTEGALRTLLRRRLDLIPQLARDDCPQERLDEYLRVCSLIGRCRDRIGGERFAAIKASLGREPVH